MKESSEYKESTNNTPKPRGLDIIKINNRWAQSNGNNVIRYLDDNTEEHFYDDDWKKYQFSPANETNFLVVLLEKNGAIADQEIANVKWSFDSPNTPHLQRQVKVFGEYKKIKCRF